MIARQLLSCVLAGAGIVMSSRLDAQETSLRRADSAFVAEDRVLARRLYEEALRANAGASRAAFRLAQLQASADSALTWYRRYVAMEPGDPWGHIALGDHLARMQRLQEALVVYDAAAAIAPNERDVAIGRARILQRAGRSPAAQDVLAAWTRRHPQDAEAWEMLGREQLRAGRPRGAAAALARAEELGAGPGAANRRRAALSLSAPAIEPVVAYQRDSDGNRTTRAGARADMLLADGVRGGALLTRGAVADAVESLPWDAAALSLAARATPDLRLDLEAGVHRYTAAAAAQWSSGAVDARLRWCMPNAAALELRGQYLPLGTAPLLVHNRVTRRELRAQLELPTGPLRLRASTRAALLQAAGEGANRRLDGGLGVVAPIGSVSEVSATYRHVTFQHAATAGYFAPRLAQSLEAGSYFELTGDSPVSLAADVGGGMQRLARHGEPAGVWKPTLRGWLYSAFSLGPARALWAELEAYDSPFAPAGVSTAPSWRFLSLSAGLRWSLR